MTQSETVHASDLYRGKIGLISGITNKSSIAYAIAEHLRRLGAEIVVVSMPNPAVQKRVQRVLDDLKPKLWIEADLTDDADLRRMTEQIRTVTQRLDFVVHSVAYSDKDELVGPYVNLTRKNFDITMAASVYSLTAMCRELMPLMGAQSAVVTLTYLGSTAYVPHYNVMGVAKAALEASVRYLAVDLGRVGARINAISAGPIKTLASSAIGGFSHILDWCELNAPLQRNVDTKDVAKVAAYLLSPLASGVTGEVHFVDAGINVMAMPKLANLDRNIAMRERLKAMQSTTLSAHAAAHNPSGPGSDGVGSGGAGSGDQGQRGDPAPVPVQPPVQPRSGM